MSDTTTPEDNPVCSFCAAEQSEENPVVKGPEGVAICGECVKLCAQIMGDHEVETESPIQEEGELLTPEEIKEKLDAHIIGQDRAKVVLSVAMYNHYKRLRNVAKGDKAEIEIKKSNILLPGSTGSGKTLLAETLAKILNVPFAIADATSLTQAGYVGDDVESIIHRLLINCDFDVERAERGIIYIDEIDKISRKGENTSLTRDVSGEGVQQALLKIIEGSDVRVSKEGGRKHPGGATVTVNTKNILFICGGAFAGIEKIIDERTSGKSSIGFGANVVEKLETNELNNMQSVSTEDLTKFGLIPELIGRLPVIAPLDTLTEEALVEILTKPKNAIVKQYTHLFSMDDVELEFLPDALSAIAKIAIEQKTGARGLQSIIEGKLTNVMFTLPSDKTLTKVSISEEFIRGKVDDPILVKGERPSKEKDEEEPASGDAA